MKKKKQYSKMSIGHLIDKVIVFDSVQQLYCIKEQYLMSVSQRKISLKLLCNLLYLRCYAMSDIFHGSQQTNLKRDAILARK